MMVADVWNLNTQNAKEFANLKKYFNQYLLEIFSNNSTSFRSATISLHSAFI